MTDDEIKDLIGDNFDNEKEVELTTRAVKFLATRMGLAKRMCNKLFGEEMVEVEDVYTMYDYLNREVATQMIIMTGEKAVQNLEAAKLRLKPEGDLN